MFSGPSLYFHYQCIAKYRDVAAATRIQDIRFLEYLYAVLPSWGMHRMGDTKTKVVEFDEFRAQIQKYKNEIHELNNVKLWNPAAVSDALGRMEMLMENMKISVSSAPLVANAKVLHHILPDLIVPIDRRYTLSFFQISNTLPSRVRAGSIVRRLYPLLSEVARANRSYIKEKIKCDSKNWDTCFTKIIDNAIIGGASFRK
jgi:hypothetical protein